MNRGERVRWYLMDLGTEVDLHTPHWHGNTGLMMGMRTDMAELLPGSMKIFDMIPDDPGTWLYHCHVNDDILAGMLALYKVNSPAFGRAGVGTPDHHLPTPGRSLTPARPPFDKH